MSLHQWPHQKPTAADGSLPVSSLSASASASASAAPSCPLPLLTLPYLFSLLALLLFAALLHPWGPLRPAARPSSPWHAYTLQEVAAFAATRGNGTVLLAAVSGPYLPFLSNWLISVRRAGRVEWVLVNSFAKLERDAAAVLPRGAGGEDLGQSVRGDLIRSADECAGWLDERLLGTVVYRAASVRGREAESRGRDGNRRTDEKIARVANFASGPDYLKMQGGKKNLEDKI